MHRRGLVLLVSLAVLATAPALAEEIIHFTNGSTLPVRTHVIEGDMIKVDLGDDGYMAFPRSVVEKIEKAGADVMLKPSISNRIAGANPSTYVTATPAPDREGWELPDPSQRPTNVVQDSKGVAVVPVFGPNAGGRSKIMSANVAGRTGIAMSQLEGRPGSQRLGTKHVVQPNDAKFNSQRKTLRSISPR